MNSFDDFFKISKIEIKGNIDKKLSNEKNKSKTRILNFIFLKLLKSCYIIISLDF